MELLLGLVVLAAALWWYDRSKRQEEKLSSKVTERIVPVRLYEDWGGKRKRSKKLLSQQLKAWTANASLAERDTIYKTLPETAKAFTTWVEALPDDDVAVLGQAMAKFSDNLNFDLAWLTTGQLDKDPELKQALEEVIGLYGLAYWKAIRIQDDIKAFATFKEWNEAPSKGKHSERKGFRLSQKLFAKLVEKKLVPAPPPELFLAAEKERETYIVQAIRTFADKDRATFNTALKEVMGLLELPSTAPGEKEELSASKSKASGTRKAEGKAADYSSPSATA